MLQTKRMLALVLSVCIACPILFSVSGAKAPAVYTLIENEKPADGSAARPYYLGENGKRIDFPMPEDNVEAAGDSDLPSSYDLRKYNKVTPVRNQGTASSCWAFSILGAFESNYVMRGFGTPENTDFSERHLVNFSLHQRVSDPASPIYMDGTYYDAPYEYGGSWRNAANALLSGVGAVREEDAPWMLTYNAEDLARMTLPESERFRSSAHLMDAQMLNTLPRSEIKRWVMQNGGVVMSYYDDSYGLDTGGSYNDLTDAYYQKEMVDYINHVVLIVGWDDNYAISNFKKECRPKKPGAWLCKNSWGAGWRQNGYFWMSYEEASVMEYIGITAGKVDMYDNIYQYDGANTITVYDSENGVGTFANVFTAEGDETLTHVAFYSPNFTPVDAYVTVYKGKPTSAVDPTAGCVLQAGETVARDVLYGYKTVQLTKPVSLKMGETFTVVVKFSGDPHETVLIPFEGLTLENPGGMDFTYGSRPGQSFVCINSEWYDNTNWFGANHNNVPIKAMTKNDSGAATATALTVTQEPDQISYFLGETIDLTGLKISAVFSNGTTAPVSGYSISPSKFTACGEIPVTVTANVGGKTLKATFTVYVDPIVVVRIVAENIPGQSDILPDGSLNLSGMRLRAYYNNGTSKLVTGYKTKTEKQADGSVLVTVSYTSDGITQKTSFTVGGSDGGSGNRLVSVTLNGSGTLWLNAEVPYSALVHTNGTVFYTVAWSSSDPAVFTVDKSGKVCAVGEGTATLTAEATASDGQKMHASMQIQVCVPKVKSVTIKGAEHLVIGKTAAYTASVLTDGQPDYTVVWSSSDPSVFTVDQNGSVQAVGEGIAALSVRVTDTGGNMVRHTFYITVDTSAVTGVTVSGARNLYIGDSLTLAANISVTGEPTYRVVWAGSDDKVLSVDQNGVVCAVGTGTATVQVSVTDGSGKVVSASVQIRVLVGSVQSVLLSGNTSLTYKKTGKLNAQVSVAGAPQYTVTWRSSDPGTVFVDQSGKIEGRKKGSATVTAIAEDSSGKTVESSVTVKVSYAWWQKLIIYVLFGFIWYI